MVIRMGSIVELIDAQHYALGQACWLLCYIFIACQKQY
jgi:hypothetical protein